MTSESSSLKMTSVLLIEATEPFQEIISEEFSRSPEFTDILYDVAECHVIEQLSEKFRKDIYELMSLEDYYIEDYHISTYDCYMSIEATISLNFPSKNDLNKFKLTNPNDYGFFVKNKVHEI